MNSSNFSSWPSFTNEDADAIKKVLLSNKVNYWTGNESRQFEKKFAEWCGVKYAVALANGTLALDLALKALDIGAGDEVIVSPRTFIASISCIVNAGAKPIFSDVDINSGNINADKIEGLISSRTKAIICVHLAGWPCDMDPIMELAEQHGLKVIEDCAQAHGAIYKGRSVGSIGHIGAWSFCQDKIMTTGGEGGMVTTSDESLWRKMWAYKDHGKSYEAVYERQHPKGFRWLHESFGTNWRMLEIQAILGLIQLKKISEWTNKRTSNALRILTACSNLRVLRTPNFLCEQNKCAQNCFKETSCRHAFYKLYVYIKPEEIRPEWNRDRIVDEINKREVPCFQGTCSEVYLEKAFDNTEFKPVKRLVNAKALGDTSLMFLVHPTLTDLEIQKTCDVISEVMGMASL